MKRVYIQAGILSIFVLLVGVMIGMWLDNFRLDSIRNTLSESDINFNDARLLNNYFQKFGKDYCSSALQQNLAYNDKIYSAGKEIEKKIDANIFTPDVQQEWRRYTLLQTQFWLNSIELKQQCNFDYHTVVYLSNKKNTTTGEEVNNKVQSSILLDLKGKCGKKMMLIPITVDTDLVVVGAITSQFNITKYPSVIIDEKYVFRGLTMKDNLSQMLGC
ncbi:MAG: hypothetical protein HYW23_04375 [Candidatus Aenigmarchaeota archaeon]|nr:hypothetical protein [Candidatus Aenigmarchaeota archaeon]